MIKSQKKKCKTCAIVVGIVSFGPGTGCGASQKPNVFTRVASYLKWIKRKMKLTSLKNNFVRMFTDGDSSNFNKNQGDPADPGGALIVPKDDTPIIWGFFFYKLTESTDLITHCVFVTNLIHLQITQMYTIDR